MNIKGILIFILLISNFIVRAHDFSVDIDGQLFFFNILNPEKKTAFLTYKDNIPGEGYGNISGKIIIPSRVYYNDIEYKVDAIGIKAFSGATNLEAISLPAGLRMIGDLAFENCVSLTNVIFPGNEVSIASNTFYNCKSIENISFGSDWDAINLSFFKWSDNLKYINIPAKVGMAYGFHYLKNLESIMVDPNNDKYKSIDGILYSKDGKYLINCPRGYNGKVTIVSGTEKVTQGAFTECVKITELDIPNSLMYMSFMETSYMKSLASIIMRPSYPFLNAEINGVYKFLLQVANTDVKIKVLSSSFDNYINARATDPGNYSVPREYNKSKKVIDTFFVNNKQIPPLENFISVNHF